MTNKLPAKRQRKAKPCTAAALNEDRDIDGFDTTAPALLKFDEPAYPLSYDDFADIHDLLGVNHDAHSTQC